MRGLPVIDPDNLPDRPEVLAKVLPAGEPLAVTCWTCPTCGKTKRGGPPPVCFEAPARETCPLEVLQ